MFPLWLVGVLLAAFASIISNVGLNLQKLSHVREDRRRESEAVPARTSRAGYTSHNLWRLGLLLVVLGSFCDFAALAFAAQSVVAPLGALTLVSNVVVAPSLLGEPRRTMDVWATVVIVAGAVVVVLVAPHDSGSYTVDEILSLFSTYRFLVYAAAIVSLIVGLYASVRVLNTARLDWEEDPKGNTTYIGLVRTHRYVYAALAGVVGAQSVLFSKCVAELLEATIRGNGMMFARWMAYVTLIGLGVTIFLQLRWLNEALIYFDALYVVPVFQFHWVLTSVVAGLVFFGEYQSIFSHLVPSLLFPVGIGMALAGVYSLSSRRTGVRTELSIGGSMDGQEAAESDLRVVAVGEASPLLQGPAPGSSGRPGGRRGRSVGPRGASTLPRMLVVPSEGLANLNEHAWSYSMHRTPQTAPRTLRLADRGADRRPRSSSVWEGATAPRQARRSSLTQLEKVGQDAKQ